MKRVELLTALDELDSELERAFAANERVKLEASRERCRKAVDELLLCVDLGTWIKDEPYHDHEDPNISPCHGGTYTDEHNCADEGCYRGQEKNGLKWWTDRTPSLVNSNLDRVVVHQLVVVRETNKCWCNALRDTCTVCLLRGMNDEVHAERIALNLPLF